MDSGEEVSESSTRKRILSFELEAAEALAGLACSSSRYEIESRCCPKKLIDAKDMDQVTSAPQQFSENTSTVPCCPVKTTIHPSKTSRHKLTEAEKEAQKLHRILANRESARETIRRRQAMYMELTSKASGLMEENLYLKKEKELALKKYNFLKDECQFLKAQMTKKKLSEREEPRHPRTETSPSAPAATSSTRLFVPNQPSPFPFIWPAHFRSSDHMNAERPDIPAWDEIYLSILGEKCSTGINKPQTPIFILPVPWMLPFNTHCSMHEACPMARNSQIDTSPISSRIASTSYNPVERSNFPSKVCRKSPGTAAKHTRCKSENTCKRPSFSDSGKSTNAETATEARRKRKELMKLKNVQGHDSHLP